MNGGKHTKRNPNRRPVAERDGFALVTALLVVLVLSMLALAVAWIATSERRTTLAESLHLRSLYSADAGTEDGINLIRVADEPPQIINFSDNSVHIQPETALEGNQTYTYEALFLRRAQKPGWGIDYKDYDYRIAADGRASVAGQASVDVVVSRLFKEGY